MDIHPPLERNPPSQEAKYPANADHSNKDGSIKISPYSVKEQAKSNAAGGRS